MEFTASEVSVYYSERAPDVKQRGHREWRGPCPVHNGQGDNFSVNSETGYAICHSSCGKGWDIIGLEMALGGAEFVRAKAEVYRIIGRPPERYEDRDIEATYDYRDVDGSITRQVVRKLGKKFFQRRPVPGGWSRSMKGVPRIPFQLDLLVKQGKDQVIALVEGEKDAINLTKHGWFATCNSEGALNFKPELAPWFQDRHVAIFPDNDEKGREHAQKVAALLKPVAASLKIVEIPDMPAKGDVSDFLSAGRTLEELYGLYEHTEEWSPDWDYSIPVPHENDKYNKTLVQYVREAGGIEALWKLPEIEGIHTPFLALTRAICGLRPGEVYLLAANQGMGKSSLAMQFAISAMKQMSGVLLFSMEMGHRDVFQRLVSIEARVDISELRGMRAGTEGHDSAKDRLAKATRELSKLPLIVSTRSSVTPQYLLEETARLKESSGNVGLVIVDHTQLMGSTGKAKDDYNKFTEISRVTKHIAEEVGVPLLLVSQCSRKNASDRREELEDHDIRSSGAFEEDAGTILLLYYNLADYKLAKQDIRRLAKGPIKSFLKLSKNRYGPQSLYFRLLHQKAFTRFDLESVEYSQEETHEAAQRIAG